MKSALLSLLIIGAVAGPGHAASRLAEPTMRLLPGLQNHQAHPRVALTFDACSGLADQRILTVLTDNAIPATVFVTGRWLKRNEATLAVLKSRPDLFEIEDHGAMHVPAIDEPVSVYGIAAAGSAQAVADEVTGGAQAIVTRGVPSPHWFRGATAKYTLTSIAEIRKLGFKVAGYSLNGDGGSLFGAAFAEKTIARARDGDVVIAHINQPNHAAGNGVAQGILDLKAKGYDFVRLDAADEAGADATTN